MLFVLLLLLFTGIAIGFHLGWNAHARHDRNRTIAHARQRYKEDRR